MNHDSNLHRANHNIGASSRRAPPSHESVPFWKAKSKADATKWAQSARLQAESIDRDAATGKWDAVKASAGTLGQQCQACHTTYRERFDDGSYRIKIGAR